MAQDWTTLISQFGFPIVVAGYLLLRMESTIKELTKAVNLMAAKLGVEDDGSK